MFRPATVLLAAALLTGCSNRADAPPDQPTPTPTAEEAGDAVSILRPDVEEPGMVPLEPSRLVVTFAEGAELDETAKGELAKLLETRAMKEGGPITIGGHSDAGGSDAVNQRISQERADAVKAWLVAQGIDAARIKTIAFGEQNPIAPNALPDGEPDDVGRAANRRAEILVDVPEGARKPAPQGQSQDKPREPAN